MKRAILPVLTMPLFVLTICTPLAAGPKGAEPPPAAATERTVFPEGATAGWWAQVQEDIRREMYTVNWQEEKRSGEVEGSWCAPMERPRT